MVIGLDANVSVRTEFKHIGEAVPRVGHTALNAERATALQRFLVSSQLLLANKFAQPLQVSSRVRMLIF